MTDSEKLRRFGLDKIALFLLLLAGFFFAQLIVSSRAHFKPSKPVVLPGCGLAVSVPAGGFKQLSEGFEYNDNEFRLSCIMQISSDSAVMVHWRYFIVPFKKTVAERFEAQASDIGGAIEKTASEQFGQFTFDYARIFSEKNATLLLSGTTQLPDGRTLTLEVAQKSYDIDLAEKIFRSLAASVTFTPASPLADGRKLLDNFRQAYSAEAGASAAKAGKAIADILQKNTLQNYYYIKDYTGQSMGFATDAISLKNNKRDANSLTAVSLYFIHLGVNPFAEQSLFRSDPNIQTFKWISQQSNLVINRELITSIELDRESTVTIQSTTGKTLPERIVSQNFTFTSSALPEILSDTFVESFLQSSFNSVMVDLILSDGRITPALLTKAEPQKTAQPNAASAVKIVFFGTDAREQTTYFDSSGKIVLSEIRGKLSYKLERTQRDRLVADFPGWLEKLELIEQYINEKPKD
jgi:hypothetical protein